MSQTTDDIALGGAFGDSEDSVVQTVPSPTQGQDPNVDGIITEDTSLGGAFGGDESPLAQTLTGEAADSAAAAQADADRAAASAAAALQSETNADASEAIALSASQSASQSESNAASSATAAASSAASAASDAASAATSETNAATSATQSASSATAASASQTAAATSAANALSSSQTATTAATTAVTKASEASASATTANVAATTATTAANTATSAATTATNAASTASNAAIDASNHEDAAAASATSAAASAASALTSKNAASTSETNAASSASSASTSASNAASSETNAATSANTASTGAATATTKASEASVFAASASASAVLADASETNAAASESAAALSASAAATSATNAASSAAASATSASNAASSASSAGSSEANAANSETNAAASESNAATSAANAATSETNAADSELNAANSASTASTAATTAVSAKNDAENSKNAAASSATAAATSATQANSSATSAATYASNAATASSAASGSEANALTYRNAAQTAQAAAELALDQFTDLYLGAKTTAPTADNDGNALQVGALYANVVDSRLYFWTGTVWTATLLDANITQLIDDAVAGLIDSAPTTLDTLNELAAALGDDPNFSATIAAQIGSLETTKADTADIPALSREAVGEITNDLLGFPNRTDSTIAFDEGTRVFTLAPVNTSFTLYYKGKEHVVSSALTLTITNQSGGRYIKFNPVSGELQEGTINGHPSLLDDLLVAYIFWDSVNQKAIIFGEERHGSHRDTQWHLSQHLDVGAVWRSGGALTYALNNNDATISVSTPVVIADEDLVHTISHGVATNAYEQVLNGDAEIPTIYLSGTNTTQTTPTTVPWKKGTTLVQYNPITTGSGALVEAANNSYVCYWLIATNDTRYPVKAIMGHYQHSNIADAEAEEFDSFGFSVPELCPMYQVILRASSSATYGCQIQAVYELGGRKSTATAGFSASSHENLSDRSLSDQHPIAAITGLQTALDSKVTGTGTYNNTNWDTAYSWGNHASAGYADATSVQNQIDTVIAGLSTANWNTAYNDRITGLSFNTGDGVLTANQGDGSTLTVDLDGRFQPAGSYDNYVSWTISDGTASEAITSGNTLKIVGAGASSTSYDAATNTLTITSTDTNTDTNTTYSAGSGISLSGTTFSHADTSSQASVNNSGATVIQDITLDTYGHITGLASKTLTYSDVGAAASSHSHSYLPLSGGTINGTVTINSTNDAQLYLNGNSSTWAGISWTDSGGTDYMWFSGATGTFALGGGGSSGVTGKRLHVDGSMSIGANYDSQAPLTNGLDVEGGIRSTGYIKSYDRLIVEDDNNEFAVLTLDSTGKAFSVGCVGLTTLVPVEERASFYIYDNNNSATRFRINTSGDAQFEKQITQNGGRYVRDSYYPYTSGQGSYYGSGNAGWTKIAQVTITGNCSGANIYGTLWDRAYHHAEVYQIAVVIRAECDFTTNNESHVVEVGCTVLGSSESTDYRGKIRVQLTGSSTNSRTYELQAYETAWNDNSWELWSSGWTIYSSPQAIGTDVGTPRVQYRSRQSADAQWARDGMYAPVYYDSNDTTKYIDPNGTSQISRLELTSKIDVRNQTGTWIESDVMTDAIGWNTSYGVYIGSNVGGTHYIRGNGTFTTGGNTYNLWHSGNDGSGSGLDADTVDGYHASRITTTEGVVSGDWNSIFNTGSTYTSGIYQVQNITTGHSNQPTSVYTYGGVFAWRLANSTFKMYASHTGDLVYQTGWSNDAYSGWRAPVVYNVNANGGGGSIYSTVLYDSDDTGYYVNPNSTSRMYQINFDNLYYAPNTNYGFIGTSGYFDTVNSGYSSDPLELIYLRGTEVRIGPNGGDKPVKAATYYDYADTGYYVDPNSVSRMSDVRPTKITRADHHHGYLEGSYNNVGDNAAKTNPIYTIGSNYCPSATALSNMYGIGYTVANGGAIAQIGGCTGWGLYVAADGDARVFLDGSGGKVAVTGDMRSPIYYDSNDTGYYVDPNSTSRSFRARGEMLIGPNTSSRYLRVGGNGGATDYSTISTSNGNLHLDATSGYNIYLSWYNTSDVIVGGGLQATIYYDRNNTGYYCNPNGTSNLYSATFPTAAGSTAISINSGGILDILSGTGYGYNNYIYGGTDNYVRVEGVASNGLRISSDSLGGGILLADGSVRSPIFYDSNNTGYYADPASTSSFNALVTRGLRFHGVGGDSGAGTVYDSYAIYQQGGSWSYPYPDLCIGYHTGIKIGAHYNYNGTRFYNNSDWVTQIASIGDGDNNMRSYYDVIAYASDKRLKENIVNIPDALNKVMQINGVTFDWKAEVKDLGFEPDKIHECGVLAQEIQAVLPEAVEIAPFDYDWKQPNSSKSGEQYLTVKYEKIVPLLIEAIKEQQSQIDELKAMLKEVLVK